MISFFTCPKKNLGLSKIHQTNSFNSIKKLDLDKEIIVFDQFKNFTQDPNLITINSINCNDFDTPYISDIFEKAIIKSKYEYLIYFNSDIIFDETLSNLIKFISTKKLDKFIAFGKRYDIESREYMSNSDIERLNKNKSNYKLHNKFGIDYFIFYKKSFFKLKKFLIGRTCWDNWMIYECNRRNFKLIDTTIDVNCFHQNHDFSHIKSSNEKTHYKGTERDYNYKLSGGHKNLFNIDDSNFYFINHQLKKILPHIFFYKKVINYFERNIRTNLIKIKTLII